MFKLILMLFFLFVGAEVQVNIREENNGTHLNTGAQVSNLEKHVSQSNGDNTISLLEDYSGKSEAIGCDRACSGSACDLPCLRS